MDTTSLFVNSDPRQEESAACQSESTIMAWSELLKRTAIVGMLMAAAVTATKAQAATLLDADFLRVAVTCPAVRDEGLLVSINENRRGEQGKLAAIYRHGKLEYITQSESADGKNYSTVYTMSRSISDQIGGGELQLFRAFEHMTDEIMKFYCFADEPAKDFYEEAMEFNRRLLKESKP